MPDFTMNKGTISKKMRMGSFDIPCFDGILYQINRVKT